VKRGRPRDATGTGARAVRDARRVGRTRIRTRLLALVLVPLVALGGFAAQLAGERLEQARVADRILAAGQVSASTRLSIARRIIERWLGQDLDEVAPA
jgi:hypothetical protein